MITFLFGPAASSLLEGSISGLLLVDATLPDVLGTGEVF
jgi:hypothetical protein